VELYQRVYAWTSCAAGSLAFLAAILWYAHSWNDGLEIPPVPPDDLTDLDALFGLVRASILFDYGVPLLCGPGLLFGLAAWKHPVSKVGLLLATVALFLYLFYVWRCTLMVHGAN
jgi:hypothetical protein